MTKIDPEIIVHREWIGFVQPTGLVVSATALVRAGAILDRRDTEGQRLLRGCAEERAFSGDKELAPCLPDFRAFAQQVLGWSFSTKGYAGTADRPIPAEIEVPLPDYGETLRPDFAVRELDALNGRPSWQLLVRVLEPAQDFDRIVRGGGQLEASAHGRMERLLRQTGVSAGLIFNGRALRLVSSPRGESSGWMDFRIADMVQTAGRPISTAMRLLLGQPRLLSLPRAQRLTALLEDSRKFQNEVSERLAQQVLHALYELLRGFQAAHDASKGELLRTPLSEHPDEVYRAMLNVILRLVFLLYAEERGMLPDDETFLRYYSLAGLYERLREDAALYPDTMDQRYGAWAQLLVLFRMIFDGAKCDSMRLPKRHGVLFDPDRFPFLEGRQSVETRQINSRIEPPLVPDGTIYRALEKLLVLDGERISYRALDVEQIGSVYETMMGFRLETVLGRSIAIKTPKKQGAPTAVDLEALLGEPKDKWEKWLQNRTNRKFADAVKKAVKDAGTVEDLHAALQPVIDLAASPDLVPRGAMVLQPSEERRRSGSHYTPRSLTEPIVRTTLEPILAGLRGVDGRPPTPEQILDLKVCDPAMGSGAFLVETCRQLGDTLIESWNSHGGRPQIPADEDEVIFARRLVAQRCLYGVDRNPVAVDLAKVSLWLVTLARDHALTFVDHALRHGDSLVGLSRKQIEAFHWDPDAPSFQTGFEAIRMREYVSKVAELRQRIRNADESLSDLELRDLWDQAQLDLSKVRLFGDLVLAAFFESEKPKERERKRSEYADTVVSGDAERYRSWLEEWRHTEPPLAPFHWEIEFPEVFEREACGFDAVVGNPPFAGKNTMAAGNHGQYLAWLKTVHAETHGNSDLVAHFFRRAFNLLRQNGALGMLATKTIRQGDTRHTGLRWICTHGGTIYSATRRLSWPGQAAVVVAVVHIAKGVMGGPHRIDARPVEQITAYLFDQGTSQDPERLHANDNKCFVGNVVLGIGFTFDDDDRTGQAGTIAEMRHLIEGHPRNRERIFPYLNGQEVNTRPDHHPSRYVINFGTMTEEEARRWPDLMSIVERKVKPARQQQASIVNPAMWWRFARSAYDLYESIVGLDRILARALTSTNFPTFTFLPAGYVYDQTLIVFPFQQAAALAVLASSVHEVWALFVGGSMKDDPRYNVEDCFRTFPFPEGWQTHPALEAAGKSYYDFRAALMVRNNEGLTKTYNRFHDPDDVDSEIVRLRELHAAMDHTVLDAYGWADIPTDCEFLLDYMIDEEEWGYKKKPWRYRWPEEVHDEVLARLLELNARRAQDEALAGTTTTKKRGSTIRQGGALLMTTRTENAAPVTSRQVRERLLETLKLDLVGPWIGHTLAEERLPGWVRPSNWYLTGFLIPSGTPPDKSADADEDDEVGEIPGSAGLAEESSEERKAAKKGFFPSSMGLSFLVPKEMRTLAVLIRWGDYAPNQIEGGDGKQMSVWQRRPREETVDVALTGASGDPVVRDVSRSDGLQLHVVERQISAKDLEDHIPLGTRSVSVFLVNRRTPIEEEPDIAYAFQSEIEVRSDRPFVPRPDLRGARTADWDEQVADLHYADTPEYATGHGVSAEWEIVDRACRLLRTSWIPCGEVEKTVTVDIEGVELSMETLGALADGAAVEKALRPLVTQYREWVSTRRAGLGSLLGTRRVTAEELLRFAGIAADRIDRGIAVLATDPAALDAFRVANRSVARALRQRFKIETPRWRAFQLAFILLNLPGLADPRDPNRGIVDLLFFPTGGGKTEAYFGLAAFAMVLRRLRHPGEKGLSGAGVSVIMRYTLRLLTLDQLARAAGLVCALELEREKDRVLYGEWPFEIGLWVGKAATPNILGKRGDGRSDSARSKVQQFKADPRSKPSPIPLENCPWCGTRFTPDSFALLPDADHPSELHIVCTNFECDFTRDRPLPIVAVDEPIYRRLPAFLIATVDKFAALPWVGQTGMLLGGADRYDKAGFYGAAEPGKGTRLAAPLPPPDLVIQDELHLIAGPLGTMAGLYETAIEALCVREVEGRAVRPKIVASTATVRRAQDQIQALFARPLTQIFPPPGPDRRDSFFARTVPSSEVPARLYLGIASQGRNPKVLMRKAWLALMGAAERAYRDAGGHKNLQNPADPYMTVLGYFNSLRELGGARRILEEEVQNTIKGYGARKRIGGEPGLFQDRKTFSEVVELTSRVSTDKVAEARRRLECGFHEAQRVDCAIATNMISVGLDIQRLGLMVILGQPKTHSEYIQASSRVGRDDERPGLVVTLLNIHKPRDRSHYERFRHYHETFYRSVEVGSVTPFSARALDRGFAGAMVGLARHIEPKLTPPQGVERIADVRAALELQLLDAFLERVREQPIADEEERKERLRSVQNRIVDLLDSWRKVLDDYRAAGVALQYQKYELKQRKPLLREMLDNEFESEHHRKFRANRSLRDVEPEVNLFLKDLSGVQVEEGT